MPQPNGRPSAWPETPPDPYEFHHLRQACQISDLRLDLTRLSLSAEQLKQRIEDDVESVRQLLGTLDEGDLTNATRLAPVLGEAVSALIDIRDAARRLDTSQTGHAASDPTTGSSDGGGSTPSDPVSEPANQHNGTRVTVLPQVCEAPVAGAPPPDSGGDAAVSARIAPAERTSDLAIGARAVPPVPASPSRPQLLSEGSAPAHNRAPATDWLQRPIVAERLNGQGNHTAPVTIRTGNGSSHPLSSSSTRHAGAQNWLQPNRSTNGRS